MTVMFEVYYDVPLPKSNRAPKGVQRKYPIDTMRVGGMFFVPERTAKAVSSYISRIAKGHTGKFTTRRCWVVFNNGKPTEVDAGTEGAIEGTGVWRVE